MPEIRKIIELLTKILLENGFSEIKADVFRQAKFNMPEATIPMWKLLFESICFCNCRFIDESIKNLASDIDDDIIRFVKQGLINLGYVSPHLNSLPYNASNGSRELLLAFGWLFCRKKIIDQMIKSSSPTVLQFAEFYKERFNQVNIKDEESLNSGMSGEEYLDSFLALNNDLRLNLNDFFSLELENAIINHKISEESKSEFGENINNLTNFDIYLLQNPEMLNEYMKLIDNDNCKLEHFLAWKKEEPVFWQWMESVLEAKINNNDTTSFNEKDTTSNERGEVQISLAELQKLDESFVKQCKANLFLLINRYSDIISYVESSLQDNESNISLNDLDILLESLDAEICNQTMAIKNLKLERRDFQYYGSKKFILVNESKICNKFINNPGRMQNDEIDINREISNLKETINKIEKKLSNKQKDLLLQLDQIGQNFKDIIIVPPLNLRHN